jgi:hypothetical protein
VTFSIKTLSITTFRTLDLIVTLSKKTLSISIKFHYAECHILFIVMLNVLIMSPVMPNVVMLSVCRGAV